MSAANQTKPITKKKMKSKSKSKSKSRSLSCSKSPNGSNTSFISKKNTTSRSNSRSKSPNASKTCATLQKSRSFSSKVDLTSPITNSSFKKIPSFEKFQKKDKLHIKSSTKLKEIESKLGAERKLREEKIKKIIKKSKSHKAIDDSSNTVNYWRILKFINFL